jgi:hypothetical protein
VTRIGHFVDGAGVRVLDATGAALDLPAAGWSHMV